VDHPPNVAGSSGAGTLEGLSVASAACCGSGIGQAKVDRYSGAQLARRFGERAGKRVRGDRGDNPGQGLRPQTLEGRNPGEQPAVGGLIARRRARDSWKGRSPEAAAARAGPPLRRLVNRVEKRHVGASGRKRAGDLPRGESSEG
jgi:hypothetical protein